jgi:hypothetical protein
MSFVMWRELVFREGVIGGPVSPELLENVPQDFIAPQMGQYKIQVHTWLCSRLFEVLYQVSFWASRESRLEKIPHIQHRTFDFLAIQYIAILYSARFYPVRLSSDDTFLYCDVVSCQCSRRHVIGSSAPLFSLVSLLERFRLMNTVRCGLIIIKDAKFQSFISQNWLNFEKCRKRACPGLQVPIGRYTRASGQEWRLRIFNRYFVINN